MATNRETVRIGTREIEIEASLGANLIYFNEFSGAAQEPYVGNLMDDILKLMVFAESNAGDGYKGLDIERLLAVVWAMGQAAGSIDGNFGDFMQGLAHEDVSFNEFASAYVKLQDLVGRTFFREREGAGDAQEPDEVQEREERA